MNCQSGFLKSDIMLANIKTCIEKVYLLKFVSLSKRDQKWVIRKLKKNNKPAYDRVIKSLIKMKKFKLSFQDFNDIYTNMNFNKYFVVDEQDKKINYLNAQQDVLAERIIPGLSYSDMKLFVFCDNKLTVKKIILEKLKTSPEYTKNKFDLTPGKNEKINTSLISYLYQHVSGSSQ